MPCLQTLKTDHFTVRSITGLVSGLKPVAQNSLQATVRFVLIMTMQARLAQYIDEPGGYD